MPAAAAVLLALAPTLSYAFYLPGVNPKYYGQGDA